MADRRIVLLGGGHTQLIAAPKLRMLLGAAHPITLIAPATRLLYSGMMPGWLAGQYSFDECALPLEAIARRAGIEWIHGNAVDIDFRGRTVHLSDGPSCRYDLLSINVGSANDPGDIGVGPPTLIPTKPFASFVTQWQRWEAGARDSGRLWGDHPPGRVLIVGAGAAAVEIAFALATLRRRHPVLAAMQVELAGDGTRLLPALPAGAAWLARRSLERAGVQVSLGRRYVGAATGAARFASGDPVPCDLIVVANGARPPRWLTLSARRDGVAVGEDGGIQVDDAMCSISEPTVFASGDAATFAAQAVPKSGVHALRQGPVLAESLARGAGAPVPASSYRAQPRALALLNRCDGTAIGAWGPLFFAGGWAWRWKDRIDRDFIARFPTGDPAV